jgi:hypothetical protein
LTRAGKPAVVIATEAFVPLLTVMLRARQAPESIALVLKGNPEYLGTAQLELLADRVLDEAVCRLAGAMANGELIE